MTLRVLIIHEHRTDAEALAALIDAEPDLTCSGVVTAAGSARAFLAQHRVDVVVADLSLAGGLAEARAELGGRLVIVSEAVTVEALQRAIELGATAFVGTEAPANEVLAGMRSGGNRMAVSGTTLELLLADARGWLDVRPAPIDAPARPVELTDREEQVLGLMREGFDAKMIAAHLQLSVHTARSHIKSLMRKLGAHSQLEAIAIANRLRVKSLRPRD